MEKIKGKFFLPENRNRKKKQIDGTIEIENNGLTYLDLSGAFLSEGEKKLFFLERKEKVNIWGIVENGSKISLMECSRSHLTAHLGPGGMQLEKYRVEFVLKNDWVENIHTKYFNKLSVTIKGLDQWLNITGGKESISYNDKVVDFFSYSYKIPEQINFKIERGLKSSFYFTLNKENELFRYNLQQSSCLEFSSDRPQSLSYFIEKLYHFTRFLNIISDSVLDFEFVVMTSFKNESIVIDNETYYEDINLIFFKENFSSQNNDVIRHLFLVKYDLIKDKFEEIINAWFQLKSDQFQRIIDIMYECIENRHKVNIYLFLAISQAVEGFYRIDKNQRHQHLDKMIRIMLVENIGNIHFHSVEHQNRDIDEQTKFIKELRNNLTHIGKFPSQEIKSAEIYFYTNLLRNILSIALLKKIGIDEKFIIVNQ